MNNKKLAKQITDILKIKFPKPECALTHETPWQLLIATILSAQCTDVRVNMVTPILFSKYPTIESLAAASIEQIEKIIKSTGFYHNKAKNIKKCTETIVNKHSSIVPNNLKELTELPGVGRKTANVLLGTAFNKAEGIVVDTHVARLSQRFGLTSESDAVKIEQELIKLIPKKDWIIFSHLLILHGRDKCSARKPKCESCELINICPKLSYS